MTMPTAITTSLSVAEFFSLCRAQNECPCIDGHDFAVQYETMAEVWEKCPFPEWLRWICVRLHLDLDPQALRLFACWCVRHTPLVDGRTTWDLLTDHRSRTAVEISERFARGEATEAERAAAWAASREAAWNAAGAAQAGQLRATIPNPFLYTHRIN